MSDVDFERRVEGVLRATMAPNARAKAAIMDRVRVAARDGMPRRELAFPVHRTMRRSIMGVALAAGIGSITTVSTLMPSSHGVEVGAVTSVIIGDSVVDRLRDTMRLVRLMFNDPAARRVAVVGDFNGWRTNATQMTRDEHTGRWAVTLALHDGDHRYAIVVDNTRWKGDFSPKSGDAAQAYSLLRVSRAAN